MRQLLLFILLFSFSFTGWAQNKKELEQQKNRTLQDIKETQKILEQTEDEKVVSLGQLHAIRKQIEARESLIKSINHEINLLNTEIKEVELLIFSLEEDLKNLKKEYAAMVYITYKANKGFNKISFIFSANTFHEFYMRLKYMEQYSKARKSQVAEIEKVKEMLEKQVAFIESKNVQKQKLREEQLKENENLLLARDKQDKMVAKLTRKENELRNELNEKKKAVDKIDNLIADLVAKEMKEAASASATASERSAFRYASSSFADNRAKLMWPVSNGFVSGKFGIHPHPILKGINEKNDGINIQTNRGEKVYTVFDGKVTKVAIAPPPFYNLVIVQHGEYFTVYAKLSTVTVKTGQKVKANDELGKVYTDKNGISEVHFMVWKNSQKLDPEKWLAIK
ncbi:MAG: murein hydrolase activator EnvC family protein [Cyclobacteriaceae bacterium]